MERLFRIGVFYDGSHFVYAQGHFYGKDYGWLSFRPFHKLLEQYVQKQIQGNYDYKVVYSACIKDCFQYQVAMRNKEKWTDKDIKTCSMQVLIPNFSQCLNHQKQKKVSM